MGTLKKQPLLCLLHQMEDAEGPWQFFYYKNSQEFESLQLLSICIQRGMGGLPGSPVVHYYLLSFLLFSIRFLYKSTRCWSSSLLRMTGKFRLFFGSETQIIKSHTHSCCSVAQTLIGCFKCQLFTNLLWWSFALNYIQNKIYHQLKCGSRLCGSVILTTRGWLASACLWSSNSCYWEST